MNSSSIHAGAREHYEDAESYEERYEGRSEDIEFYLRRLRRCPDVLEYGAGAGRLTFPLLHQGHSVVAVDTSDSMLSLLKRRAEEMDLPKGKLRVQKADMRSYSTRVRFDAVVAAFHTVCHLYTTSDMVAFLTKAKKHLNPGGVLSFDLPLPRIDMPGYDPIAQVRVTDMGTPAHPQLLTQRWYQPQEILMHLHYAGFRRIKLESDFEPRPVDSETNVVTVTARRD